MRRDVSIRQGGTRRHRRWDRRHRSLGVRRLGASAGRTTGRSPW